MKKYLYFAGMLVVIVLAMALFVGLFILVAGVLCLTRSTKRLLRLHILILINYYHELRWFTYC